MKRKNLGKGLGKGYKNIISNYDKYIHSLSARGVKTKRRLKLLQMNPVTYKLRREVMGYVYEARQLADLPRIKVRVIEDDPKILGVAKLKGNVLWITKKAVEERELRSIVYHEILHAVYGIKHAEKCPLMRPTHKPIDKKVAQKCFKYWVEKVKKK
jgi:hypothetical protein